MNKNLLSYVSGHSFLHKADPRVKIVSLMILSLFIFQTRYIWSLFFILILFLGVVFSCRVSLKRCFFAVRPLLFFIGALFLIQFLFAPTPVFSDAVSTVDYVFSQLPSELNGSETHFNRVFFSGSPDIYSFFSGVGLSLKFILLILFSSLMILTTKQSGLISGIEKIVRPLPLRFVRLTHSDVALMAMLMLRFIPLLLSVSSQTMDSARSRAFIFSKHPVRGISLITSGLIRSVLSFSDVVSAAMKNRGYTGVGRTHFHEPKLQKRDFVFFLVFVGLIALIHVFVSYYVVLLFV